MKVVVDTSVIIDFLRTKKLDALFVRLQEQHTLTISLITYAELFSAQNVQHEGEERDTLEAILANIEVVIPTKETARLCGQLRAHFQIALADAFIAALAIERHSPLATENRKDFQSVKNLILYKN